MTKDELQQAYNEQQARVAELEAKLAEAAAAPVTLAGAEFPRLLYKAGGKPGQIDHVGNDVFKIDAGPDAEAQLAAALEDGWSKTPIVPVA